MAEGLDLDSCEVRLGVLASLFNPDYATMRTPFREHVIPGTINAVDYDLGNQGVTYSDSDVMATTGAPGGGNNGTKYRNDGVDIESSTDPEGFDFNVGWTETLEWLTYSVDVETTGQYDVEIRVASAVGGGEFRLLLDNEQLGSDLAVANTGGWQNWVSVWTRNVSLTAGEHILKLLARRGGFNVNRMRFTLISATEVEELPVARSRARLVGHYPNPFGDEIRIAFDADRAVRARLEVFDVLGRRVFARPWQAFGGGAHTLTLRPGLASGSYFFRLILDDGLQPQSFMRPMIVF